MVSAHIRICLAYSDFQMKMKYAIILCLKISIGTVYGDYERGIKCKPVKEGETSNITFFWDKTQDVLVDRNNRAIVTCDSQNGCHSLIEHSTIIAVKNVTNYENVSEVTVSLNKTLRYFVAVKWDIYRDYRLTYSMTWPCPVYDDIKNIRCNVVNERDSLKIDCFADRVFQDSMCYFQLKIDEVIASISHFNNSIEVNISEKQRKGHNIGLPKINFNITNTNSKRRDSYFNTSCILNLKDFYISQETVLEYNVTFFPRVKNTREDLQFGSTFSDKIGGSKVTWIKVRKWMRLIVMYHLNARWNLTEQRFNFKL
ncbi:hypothetical protein Btru_039091 [Bulinus truncatus]|nr:hypothetical protein Btru_039091 [Bulinus truncatus]